MAINLHSRTFRMLVIAAAVLIAVCWGLLRWNVFAANVAASWSYDFGPEPGCSASRSTNCIDHFEIDDITNQQNLVLIQTVSNPNPARGKIDHIATSFKYGPPFGQRTISVIAVGKGPNGERITSNPFAARATITIRPGTSAAVIF